MGMQIKDISDKAFSAYGKVITGVNTAGILKEMERTPLPDDVIYVPSVPELEALPEAEIIKNNVYGELPIQIGYCNGHNKKLNAVEYHRNSEINIAEASGAWLSCQREPTRIWSRWRSKTKRMSCSLQETSG